MTARVVARSLTGDPIVEDRLDGGFIRRFAGDPRVCPVAGDHLPHRFDYSYVDRTTGLVKGHYECRGEGEARDLPPRPELVLVDLRFLPPPGHLNHRPDDPAPKVVHVTGAVPWTALQEFIRIHDVELS